MTTTAAAAIPPPMAPPFEDFSEVPAVMDGKGLDDVVADVVAGAEVVDVTPVDES